MIGAASWSSTSYPGSVFVYSMSPSDRTSITYQGIIQAPTPVNNECFGTSIALGVDALFVGTASAGIHICMS
jgi:hypothetical protein